MEVYLFRHGQTPGNAAHRYLGITDEPLSELGRETAKRAGSDPTVSEVLVSPLRRTQMTASILFPNARQIVCQGFREMDFGDFEGRSAQEMADDPDYRYWVEATECMGPCPHGDATWKGPWRRGRRGSISRFTEASSWRCSIALPGHRPPSTGGPWTTARATAARWSWAQTAWSFTTSVT